MSARWKRKYKFIIEHYLDCITLHPASLIKAKAEVAAVADQIWEFLANKENEWEGRMKQAGLKPSKGYFWKKKNVISTSVKGKRMWGITGAEKQTKKRNEKPNEIRNKKYISVHF